MDGITIGVVSIVILIVCIFLKVWIGVAMGVVGIFGIAVLTNWQKAITVAATEPYVQIANYTFTCVPLFVLMGVLISNSGIGADLFNSASKWIGHIRGGLAIASTVACGIFAAVSGSSMATAATMGKVAFPEMRKFAYSIPFSAGALAAGGTIGILIPPSIGFILYGLVTQESIGRLFMAGLLPGIFQVLFYSAVCFVVGSVKPDWAPATPNVPLSEKFRSLKGTWPVVLLIVVVLGGIYMGVFTSTEAGAIGAAGAVVIAFAARKLDGPILIRSLKEATQTAGMMMLMVIGSYIFMRFLTLSGLPAYMSAFAAGLAVPRIVVLLAVILLYLILGMFLDVMSAVVLTMPIIYPIMSGLGYDMIWFGVLTVRLIEIGLITPPVGMNVFVTAATCKVKPEAIFKGIVPFLIADALHVALLIAWPNMALMLVRSGGA
jgi:tripartite ATP-independent transporter DctM subunit